MLTGQGLFSGETTSDILESVIRAEPAWGLLPGSVPPRIREMLRRCLQKDPKQRLQAIGEARIAIQGALGDAPETEAFGTPTGGHPKLRERIGWTTAVAVLTVAAALFCIGYFSRAPELWQPIISQVVPPENAQFILTALSAGPPVLSPDGKLLALAARGADGKQFLWVRSLEEGREQPLAGSEAATSPFWSPDIRSLGFFANGKLNRIDATGGPVLSICDALSGRGGAGGTDGTILFGVLSGPIFRVPASGDTPPPVANIDASQSSPPSPQLDPDITHV